MRHVHLQIDNHGWWICIYSLVTIGLNIELSSLDLGSFDSIVNGDWSPTTIRSHRSLSHGNQPVSCTGLGCTPSISVYKSQFVFLYDQGERGLAMQNLSPQYFTQLTLSSLMSTLTRKRPYPIGMIWLRIHWSSISPACMQNWSPPN